jgi:hypothetical protein
LEAWSRRSLHRAGDELAAIRQHNRIVKATLPGQAQPHRRARIETYGFEIVPAKRRPITSVGGWST